MAYDIVSWLLDRPRTAPIGRELLDLIGREGCLERNEIENRVHSITTQLTESKKSLDEMDQKFVDQCIFLIATIGK